jgi:hypothetical protein
LAHCQAVTNKAIVSIGEHLHALRVLDLSGCRCLSDVTPLAFGCRALRHLSLRSAEHVDPDKLCDAIVEGLFVGSSCMSTEWSNLHETKVFID